MATSNKDTTRVTLPGRMFKKAGRWWWAVQLPGEPRCRARALRSPEERVGTRDRRTAEAAALNLWEAAITRKTRDEIMAEVKHQVAEKSRAYAFLVEQIAQGPKLSYRQAPWTVPSGPQMQVPQDPEPEPCPVIETVPQERRATAPEVISLRESDFDEIGGIDLTEFLSEAPCEEDRQGCECCDSKDFFDEYLQTVESGQRLCPRCVQALRDDAPVPEDALVV